MSEATVTCTVTRAELEEDDLDLLAPPFDVDGLDAGVVTARKVLARSPWVHGAQLTGFVHDLVTGGRLEVHVEGADQEEIRDSVAVLLAAFSQFSYTLQVTLDGEAWAWACQPADYSVGVTDGSLRFGLLCTVNLAFDRQPTPVAGPY